MINATSMGKRVHLGKQLSFNRMYLNQGRWKHLQKGWAKPKITLLVVKWVDKCPFSIKVKGKSGWVLTCPPNSDAPVYDSKFML